MNMKTSMGKHRPAMGRIVGVFALLFAHSNMAHAAETNTTAVAGAESNSVVTAQASTPAPGGEQQKDAGFYAAGGKMFSLSYGYVTTDYDDANTDAEGWRINGTFEMNPKGGPLVHGLAIGYMETSAERTGAQTVEYEVQSIPIYYAPKIILGKKAIKVFAKGALGCQFSEYSRSGAGGSASGNEFGFYGGGSLGAMLVLKEKFFINAEYEWVYMSNAGYQTGSAQSAMIGIGAKF